MRNKVLFDLIFSESNYDRLYDLPAGIPDVMGLQALRPSAAVCKVMSIYPIAIVSGS